MKTTKYCEGDDCDVVLVRAKYCNKHSLRFMRHGDANYRTKVAKGEWKGVSCSAPECERQVACKGLCSMHYVRDLRLNRNRVPDDRY